MFGHSSAIKDEKVILSKCLDGNSWIIVNSGEFCSCTISFKYNPEVTHNFIHFISSLLYSTNPVSSGYSVKDGFLIFDLKYEREAVFRSVLERLKSNILLVSSLMQLGEVSETVASTRKTNIEGLRIPGHDYF